MDRIFVACALICALATSAGERHYLVADTVADTLRFEILPEAGALAVEARVALDFGRRCDGSWAFMWADSAGRQWSCRVSQEAPFIPSSFDLPSARIEILAPGDSVVASGSLTSGIDTNGGYNTLAMEWNGPRLDLLYGARDLTKVLSGVPLPPPASSQMSLVATRKAKIANLIVEETPDPVLALAPTLDPAEVEARIASSSDPMEGLWVYLDRKNDPVYAIPGGTYTLCALRDPDGGYTLLYRSGAQVNSSAWQPMSIKAILTPTPFEAHYDLRWFDAMMEPVPDEAHATLDPARGILTLVFPLHHTTLRFYRP